MMRRDKQRRLDSLIIPQLDHASIRMVDWQGFTLTHFTKNRLIVIFKFPQIMKLDSGEKRRAQDVHDVLSQNRNKRNKIPFGIRPHTEDVTSVCLE